MRKIAVVFLALLFILTSCAKPEQTNPVSEIPVTPNLPVEQKDPSVPVNHYPDLKDNFFVERAKVDFYADEYINTRPVLVSLDSATEMPLFANAYLYLELNKLVKPESIQDIPGAQLINPQLLRIPLNSSTSSVVIPATLANINGTNLDREYSFQFKYISATLPPAELLSCYPQKYPELRLDGATDFVIDIGETFLLVQNWPLPREAFEKRVEEAFSTAVLTKEWLDAGTLAITIKQIATEYGWYGLSLEGVEDSYGYKHESYNSYSFSLGKPKVVKRVELATRRENVSRIPVAVSGATNMVSGSNVVELYRRHPLAYIHDATDQHFWLDLDTGKIISEIRIGSASFPDEAQTAFYATRPYISPGESVSCSVSPSGKTVATIYHVWSEDKSYLLLMDTATGSSERFLLTSQHPWDGGSNPPRPPIWSHDESRLVYKSIRDEGIFAFDLLTKTESKIVGEPSWPLFFSPRGELFFSWGGGYYMLDAAGSRQKLDTGDVSLRLVAWLDEDRALVSHDHWLKDSICYIYSIRADKLEFVSTGSAFDYDPISGTASILDTIR